MINKKYKQTTELQDYIDWDSIMKMDRCAGGHEEQMKGLFKNSTVIGHHCDDDYQGEVATCVRLQDNRYVIYNDYFGSCSGCDAWEGADDSDVRELCISLANNALVFDNLDDVVEYLENKNDVFDAHSWHDWTDIGYNLLQEILKYKKINP